MSGSSGSGIDRHPQDWIYSVSPFCVWRAIAPARGIVALGQLSLSCLAVTTTLSFSFSFSASFPHSIISHRSLKGPGLHRTCR